MRRYRDARIQFVVPLVTDDEIRRKCSRSLFDVYRRHGMDVIHFPIRDLTSPPVEEVVRLVRTIVPYLRARARVVVHCNAGTGRTAVVCACLVAATMDMNGAESIAHIQSLMHTQITDSQKRVIETFAANVPADIAHPPAES
jgi:protein-tyrosine phosphatase